MFINLEYNEKWNDFSKEKIPDAYYGILALSCALDVSYNINNHKKIIEKIIIDYPNKSNKDLWYITILAFLKNRANYKKSYYINDLITNLLSYYKNHEVHDDIDFVVNQLNAILPYEGFFISLSSGISKDDLILNTINNKKNDIRESLAKYFVLKNTSPVFLEKTISPENQKNEYIDEFEVLFDILIMFLMRTIEEIFLSNFQFNEEEVRFRIFETVENYASGVFIKNQSKIADKICSILAEENLSIKEG